MDPDLWIEALTYFALRDDDCQHEIGEVLNNIDRDNLLPPLPIIQILSQKVRHLLDSTTHGMVVRETHRASPLFGCGWFRVPADDAAGCGERLHRAQALAGESAHRRGSALHQ